MCRKVRRASRGQSCTKRRQRLCGTVFLQSLDDVVVSIRDQSYRFVVPKTRVFTGRRVKSVTGVSLIVPFFRRDAAFH